ncbi:MAG: tannase/feruloyl esterase family alpha/beta hydrolase [Candidatus Sulfotelmatobacter sp.]
MASTLKFLPAICRVVAELAPTSDSAIRVELWMPADQWNGKFRGQGNGGFAGEFNYWLLALSVFNGYASAATDTGHSANVGDATWAKGHPEKIAEFGYRAIHLMTVRSKEILAAHYGTAAKHSYFAACSDGGREALMEAQRFPADYDGILAGDPSHDWTGLLTNGLHNAQALMATPGSYIPPGKLATISSAVLAACDGLGQNAGKAQDGVADGILNDPEACHFEPSSLLCKKEDSNDCLTAPQVKTLETIYAGTRTSDGKQIFPGLAVGGEADPGGWNPWITTTEPGKSYTSGLVSAYFTNMVFPAAKPPFDLKTASIDDAFKAANSITAADLNATNPDLKPFFSRGGKLIVYQGWSDPISSPYSTIDYYNAVERVTGKEATESSVRLYMVPGMDHCLGGPGASSFGTFGWLRTQGPDDPKRDVYLALEQWVEGGMPPGEIIATKYDGSPTPDHVEMTRPLCPYPQVAKYKGSGDMKQAASFTCAAPER